MRFVRSEIEGAVADFNRALSLDDRFAVAYANRGLAFLIQGKREEAERDLSRALQLDPGLRSAVQEGIRVATLRRQ